MISYRSQSLIPIIPLQKIACHRRPVTSWALLIVSHVERGNRIRLINARELTRTERTAYEVRKCHLRSKTSYGRNTIIAELLKGGVRGKYIERYRAGTNVVLLAPDVAQAFPTEDAVNETLRLVMRMAKIPTNV